MKTSRIQASPERTTFPTETQELLLHAILDRPRDALAAWKEWRGRVEIETLDPGSNLLLPQLYHRLVELGSGDPLLPRLKGVYRFTWAKNQLLLRRAEFLLGRLQDSGIQTMILKGAAMTLLYYGDAGLRAMEDVDIAVQPQDGPAAVRILEECGLKPVYRRRKNYIPVRHGCNFVGTGGVGVDLHWHVLHQRCRAEADRVFWENTSPVQLRSAATSSPAPAELLLHTCVHGARWNPNSHLRWIADALRILGDAQRPVAWQRVTDAADALRLSVPLRHTLGYLRARFAAGVPQEAMDRLEASPVARWQVREYELLARKPGFFGEIPSLWPRFIGHQEAEGRRASPAGFLGFLREWYGLDHAWELPAALLAAAAAKIRREWIGTQAAH